MMENEGAIFLVQVLFQCPVFAAVRESASGTSRQRLMILVLLLTFGVACALDR
jgi:hypothetical protein